MKKKKLLITAICIVIISSLIITAAAVAKYKFSLATEPEAIETVNRVNITVSATEFTYNNVSQDGMLTCSTKVSIEKTEPDFYGQLHSICLRKLHLHQKIPLNGQLHSLSPISKVRIPITCPLTSTTLQASSRMSHRDI